MRLASLQEEGFNGYYDEEGHYRVAWVGDGIYQEKRHYLSKEVKRFCSELKLGQYRDDSRYYPKALQAKTVIPLHHTVQKPACNHNSQAGKYHRSPLALQEVPPVLSTLFY